MKEAIRLFGFGVEDARWRRDGRLWRAPRLVALEMETTMEGIVSGFVSTCLLVGCSMDCD
jgi:tetrahydromethanopterin S-methyltransferase subunit F